MGRVGKIPVYTARLVKPHASLADIEAKDSEQVVDAATIIAEAPVTEKNATEKVVAELNAAEGEAVEKEMTADKAGDTEQSKRPAGNKVADLESRQRACLNEAKGKGNAIIIPKDKKKEKDEVRKKAEADLNARRILLFHIGDILKNLSVNSPTAQNLGVRAPTPPSVLRKRSADDRVSPAKRL